MSAGQKDKTRKKEEISPFAGRIASGSPVCILYEKQAEIWFGFFCFVL